MYDSRIICYKNESDTTIMVVGGADENEVLLYNVLLALRDSLHLLFKYGPIAPYHSGQSVPAELLLTGFTGRLSIAEQLWTTTTWCRWP